MDPASLVFFLGAGASLGEPAGLPLFGAIADRIADALDLDTVLIDMPVPEILLGVVREAGFDPYEDLRSCLDGMTPNAIHSAAARLIAAGGTVWTTNYDRLIEIRLAQLADSGQIPSVGDPAQLRVAFPEQPDAGHRLFKPHGTFADTPNRTGSELIYESSQVGRPFDSTWAAAVHRTLAGRAVVICGYSGADVDLHPILLEALQGAAEVHWLVRDGADEVDVIRWRYRVDPEGSPDPGRAFIDWLQLHCPQVIDPEVMYQPVTRLPQLPSSLFSGLRADRYARGKAAAVLGDSRKAYWLYLSWSAWRSAKRRPRPRQIVGEYLRVHPRLNRWLCRTVLGVPWLPGGPVSVFVATRAISANLYTQVFRHFPPRADTESRSRAIEQGNPVPDRATRTVEIDDLLCRASASRMCGSIADACSHAQLSLMLAQDALAPGDSDSDVDIYRMARAAFELATNLRWLGDWDGAESLLRRSYGLLAGPRWAAWLAFDRGALALHRLNPELGIEQFERAESSFASQSGWAGMLYAMLGRCACYRIAHWQASEAIGQGAPDYPQAQRMLTASRRTLARAEALARVLPVGSAIPAVLKFEIAELLTAEKKWPRATERYEALTTSPYPVHRAMGFLGLARIATTTDSTEKTWALTASARAAADTAHCGYLWGRAQDEPATPDDAKLLLSSWRLAPEVLQVVATTASEASSVARDAPIAFA